jgi:acyl transferase domain-containing protein
VNQDGRSSGLTVPNGPSQQAVIREAIENAGVGPHELGYVEAHGTGTTLGDPIEMEALRRTLADGRPADQPLVVGSVKTNIGHLEAAAGVAGVIKVILAMRHGEIPAHLHFKTLNPHIALDGAPVAIATERRPWPAGARRRLAGVSSFGFSGTNAHVVVEEAPVEQEQRRDPERPLHLLAFSAKSEEALRELAARHAGQLADGTEPLADVAYTANAGRAHFAHRVAIVAASAPDASGALKQLGRGKAQPSIAIGQATGSAPEIAFLFTGQGSQYPGMGRELFETQPVFRDAMTRCAAILEGLVDVPLVSVLYGNDQRAAALLNQTAYTQPALFAIEFALAELWASWGIRPAALLGHSIGEYVAACVAGVFTVEDGLRLIATRARLMQALRPGSMAAVLAPAAEAADAIRSFGADLSIAALNGPAHTVISGETSSLEAAVERFAARGIPTQRLVVSHAFHSASMDPMLAEFERVASGVAFSAPKIPLASNLTGRIAGSDIASAAYWREHVRQPVRFADGVERLRDQGCRVFLEIGPRATLLGMARRAADIDASHCLPSLRPPRGDWAQMLDSLARLFVSGAAVDWAAFDRPYRRRKVTVPTYPFQRERYWLDGAGLAASEAPSIVSSQDPARSQTEPSTYRVDWIAQSVRDGAASGLSGRWIIFADEGGAGHHAAAAIDARGGQCTIVSVGDATGRAEDGRWLLNPERAGDYQRVLAEIVASGRTPVAGVLHLWSLDASSCGASALLVQREQRLTSASVLLLLQAMLRESVVAPVHVITRGAQPFAIADPAALALAAAPLWGLGRTFAVEHPELWGGLIDLDTSDPAEAARQLTGELARRDDEDQVVLRRGIRYVPRLVASAAPTVTFAGCRPDASYLVTGGLGTLGLQIARWLAERGARHLVLAGRKGLPDRSTWDSLSAGTEVQRQAEAIRAIEGLGATVDVAAADIADERDAGMLFERFGRSAPPLRGIVHAAAAMGGGRLRDMSVDALAEILRPKATGTCLLHALGERHELDFFVLFSSISSLIGTADLGHYAAANSFLDAFAGYRRAAGRPATSINWGPWQGVRGSADHLDVFARSGMRSMAAAGALAALGRAIADTPANAVVASVDWATFKPVYEARRRRPFLDTIHTSVPRAEAQPTLIEALRQVEPDRRRDVIAAHVRAQAAAVLGLPAAHLDSRKGFFDLGMDSLMSVELRRRLEGSTGLALPATLTFKYATVAALAEFLDGELPGGAPPAPASPAASVVGDEDDLSEDEIAMLLAEKLAQIR